MLKKLITREDPFHFHKSFGILVLLNFVFQIRYFIFNNTCILPPLFLIPHLMLHLSSFIFKVLKKRPIAKRSNMFIWNELRLHALIFASRAIFTIWFPYYSQLFVFLTMILADITTHFYGIPRISTVRGSHDKVGKRSITKEMYGIFFSMSQLGATLICSGCFQPEVNLSLVFFTLPPIQTSAFGMTLLRKNIISKSTWVICYSIELIIVYIAWYLVYGNIYSLFYSVVIYILRKRINKYLLWILIFGLHYIFYM